MSMTQDEAIELVRETTGVHSTPDEDDDTLVWLYSYGMAENHGYIDLQMHGVPAGFQHAALEIMWNMNAHRLRNEREFENGETYPTPHGEPLIITASVIYNKDTDASTEMWNLEHPVIDWESTCECCRNRRAGIEE